MKNLNPVGSGWARGMAALWLLSAVITARGAGLVAAWGDNFGPSLVQPVMVPPGLNSIKAISAGQGHNVALTANGTLIAWGDVTPFVTNFPTGLTGFRAISAGAGHSLAVRFDGTVLAWGVNNFGQTNVPAGLSGVVAVAGGGRHSLALLANGTVAGWGQDSSGQIDIPSGLSNVIAISAGDAHNLALTASGTVTAWGLDDSGQADVPANATNIVAVSAGSFHSLAITADGNVLAWGNNVYGQCNVPPGLSNVVAIAAGQFHSLALTEDGTVVAWGVNFEGETNVPVGLSNVTGIAAGVDDSFAITPSGPVQILQAPVNIAAPAGTNLTLSVAATGAPPLNFQWSLNGNVLFPGNQITGVTTSNLNLSALEVSQSGNYSVTVGNAFGSVLFPDATVNIFSPPILQAQSANMTNRAGTDITLFVTVTGSSPLNIQWQFNGANIPGATNTLLVLANAQPGASGQYLPVVTNPYGSAPTVPIQVNITNSPPFFLSQPLGRTNFVGGTTAFTAIARGSTPLFLQWRLNGIDIPGATNETLTLGPLDFTNAGFYDLDASNAFGEIISTKAQLIINETASWGADPPLPPPGLTNLIAVSAANQVLGLKSDGTVVLWGRTQLGALVQTNIPPGISNVMAISAGGANMVLESNGTVMAWGTPSISAQTNVPKGLTNIIAIAMGGAVGGNAFALRSNGTVVAWGPAGSLAANVPPGLSNVIAIAAGGSHCLALRANGTVVSWGASPLGQTNVPFNLSNVIAIAAGTSHSLALKSDGTLVGWGQSPEVPFGVSNVVAISAGNALSIALKNDGSVKTAGQAQLINPPDGLTHAFAVTAGAAQFFVALTDNGSPFITIQPASGSATGGSSFKLESRAVGVQPLAYQWLFNGDPISGATNVTLVLSNITGAMSGAYRMVASNSLGVATSAAATVTIPLPSTNLGFALNTTNLIWSTGDPNPGWFAENTITHDGVAAAQSGHIADGKTSILQTKVTGPGTLTFWWKVSSEEDFDFLEFFMDNLVSPPLKISGEVDWEQETIAVPSGTHFLDWEYSKDPNVSVGLDAGWLDQVTFIPIPVFQPLNLNAPTLQPDGTLLITSTSNGQPLQAGDASHFTILTSTDMVNWTTLTNPITISSGSLNVSDNCRTNGARFYRVVQH